MAAKKKPETVKEVPDDKIEVILASEIESKVDKQSLAVINDTAKDLPTLRKEYAPEKIPDAGTKEGYEVIKEACKKFTSCRTALDAAKKKVKAPFLAFNKKIDGLHKTAYTGIEVIEAPWKKAKQDQDEKEAREKQEREDRATSKIEQTMTMVLETARGESSGVVASYIEAVDAIDTDDFYPLRDIATKEKARVLDALGKLYQDRLEQEAAQEAAAKAAIDTRLANLRAVPAEYFGKTPPEISAKLASLRMVTPEWFGQEFGERDGEAVEVHTAVVEQLEQLLKMKEAQMPQEDTQAAPAPLARASVPAAEAEESVDHEPVASVEQLRQEDQLDAPRADDMVECIAEAYEVSEETARRWLRETEF